MNGYDCKSNLKILSEIQILNDIFDEPLKGYEDCKFPLILSILNFNVHKDD